MSRTALTGLAALLALAPACREDPGDPNEALLSDYQNPPGFFEEPVEGPDPLLPGEQRLGLGLFYESEVTEWIAVDNSFSNYFIFEAFPGGPLTYNQLEDTQDRVEGVASTRIAHAGLTFWGGGIFWSSPRSLAAWTTMYVSFKSSDDAFAEIGLQIESEGRDPAAVLASDYGYTNDGEWHHLVIPLADFAAAGANLTAVTAPFTMGGLAGTSGETFKIDALYLTND